MDTRNGGSIYLSLDLTRPRIVPNDEENTISITGKEWDESREPGRYNIPSRTLKVLLPPGKAVEEVKVDWGDGTALSRSLPLERVSAYLPIGRGAGTSGTTEIPVPENGGRDSRRPAVDHLGVEHYRGFTFAKLKVYPVTYDPDVEEVFFFSSPEITVELADGASYDPTPYLRIGEGGLADAGEVAGRGYGSGRALDQVLAQYSRRAVKHSGSRSIPSSDGNFPYVIVTTSGLWDNFLPLAQWKTNRGIRTEIVNLSDITSDPDYNAVDTPAEIREFIRDAYNTWSTEYVLIGGDTGTVPVRKLYGNISVPNLVEDEIPADLYYGCLDGPYNNDEDGYWGEQNDGSWGGDVDLVAEVYVGRAPVDTDAQADTFVNKVLDYERDPRTKFAERAVLSGAWLDDSTDGSLSCDDIEQQTFPDPLRSTKLYQTLGNATKSNFNNALNGGVNIVYNVGHAYNDRISLSEGVPFNSSHADALAADHRFHIFYTMGCYPNAFDNIDYLGNNVGDSLSEHMLYNQNGGSVVFIGNSRYGLYNPGNMLASPSHTFAINFFYKLFLEDIREVGKANQLGKENLTGSVSNEYMRWIYFTINYMGDPTLNVWFEEPRNLSVTHPPIIYADSPAPNKIHVDEDGGGPVEDADAAIVNWPDLFGKDTTNVTGDATVTGTPTVVGTANITVTGDDLRPFYDTVPISDDSDPPTITVNDAFYGPYREDPGAVIDLDFSNGGGGSDLWFAQYKDGITGRWTDIFNDTAESEYTDEWNLDWHNLGNGNRTIYVRCFDKAWNYDEATFNFEKDYLPPEIHLNFSASGWYNEPPEEPIDIQFLSMRPGVNLERGYYTINDGAEIEIFNTDTSYYETEVTPDWGTLVNGTNWLNFSVLDAYSVTDNSNATLPIKKDVAPPGIIINNASYGYFTSDPGPIIDVNFHNHNLSALMNASFRVNDGKWRELFTGPLSLFTSNWSVNYTQLPEGGSLIDIRAWDEAGNVRLIDDALTIGKDTEKPGIIVNTPVLGWYGSDPGNVVDVDFSSEGGSPLVLAQYRIEGGSWHNVFNTSLNEHTANWSVDPGLLDEGVNEIDVRVVDSVNNVEVLQEAFEIKMDYQRPSIIAKRTTYGFSESRDIVDGYSEIVTTFTNGGSGSDIRLAQYRVGKGGEWTEIFNLSDDNITYSWHVNGSLLDQGENRIFLRVFDECHRDDDDVVLTMYYDSRPPIIGIDDADRGWYNSEPEDRIEITVTENGTGSNISFIRYKFGEDGNWTYLFEDNHTLIGPAGEYDGVIPTVFGEMEEGENLIYLEAEDHAGLHSELTISYKKDTQPPSPVDLCLPLNGMETSSKDIQLSWSKVETAIDESGISHYRYQIAKTTDFSTVLIDKSTENLTEKVPVTEADRYVWRVRGVDEAGNEGEWSEVWRFFRNSAPVAIINVPSRGVIYAAVELDGSLSTDEDGDIESYAWKIDNTVDLTGKKVSYKFNANGSHKIRLVVTDQLGKVGVTDTYITIGGSDFEMGDEVSFNGADRRVKGVFWSEENQTWMYELEDGEVAKEGDLEPKEEKGGWSDMKLWGKPWQYVLGGAAAFLMIVLILGIVIIRRRGYSALYCPNCGEKVRGGRKARCPNCKESLYKEKSPYLLYDCPRCGYPVYEWENECKECRLSLTKAKVGRRTKYGRRGEREDFGGESYRDGYERYSERESGVEGEDVYFVEEEYVTDWEDGAVDDEEEGGVDWGRDEGSAWDREDDEWGGEYDEGGGERYDDHDKYEDLRDDEWGVSEGYDQDDHWEDGGIYFEDEGYGMEEYEEEEYLDDEEDDWGGGVTYDDTDPEESGRERRRRAGRRRRKRDYAGKRNSRSFDDGEYRGGSGRGPGFVEEEGEDEGYDWDNDDEDEWLW